VIGSAAMTEIALFSAFIRKAGLSAIDVAQTKVMAGLIIVAIIAFFFSSLAIKSVGKTANKMISEVRRQFKEMASILEYTKKPDYAQYVTIASSAAYKEMMLPAMLAITLLVVGFIFGFEVALL
jgi:Na+/H+-translocating membrane pyrophosphatase